MADFQKYLPTLLRFEGGYVNNPADHGGPTKYGITLAEWLAQGYDKDRNGKIDVADLKAITPEDAGKIAKAQYWDRVNGDGITNQVIAEFLTDFAYNCGVMTAIEKTQEVLGLSPDGVMGPLTLTRLNQVPQDILFKRLQARREQYYRAIVANHPSQAVFLKGWLLRNNSFQFKP